MAVKHPGRPNSKRRREAWATTHPANWEPADAQASDQGPLNKPKPSSDCSTTKSREADGSTS